MKLTNRQWQVVKLVTDGLMNRDIGAEMGISELTVKQYMHKIFDITGMGTRLELALWYLHRTERRI